MSRIRKAFEDGNLGDKEYNDDSLSKIEKEYEDDSDRELSEDDRFDIEESDIEVFDIEEYHIDELDNEEYDTDELDELDELDIDEFDNEELEVEEVEEVDIDELDIDELDIDELENEEYDNKEPEVELENDESDIDELDIDELENEDTGDLDNEELETEESDDGLEGTIDKEIEESETMTEEEYLYEKKKRKELKKERRKGKRKKFFKIARRTTLILFLFSMLAVGIVGCKAYDKYMPLVNELRDSASEKLESIDTGTFKDKTETVIYDRDGNILAEVAPNDYYYINYEDIQPRIEDALLSIEDIRYYEHEGYDLKAIARAAYHVIKNKGEAVQGGSTITQQLVKLQFLTTDKTYERKIEEIMIAAGLEDIYSKEQILEFYLNNINYGNGAYGIETASITYFNKPSSELNLSEIAFLTAIPNNPSLYNPVRYMDNTIKRRDLILYKMLEYGKITEEEYNEAKNFDIVLDMPEKEFEPESYVVSYALSSATKELMSLEEFNFRYWFSSEEDRQEYNEDYNDLFVQLNKKIRNGGYKIYTTFDMEKQEELQKTLNDGLSTFTKKDDKTGLYETQGSAVTIDNKTGDVLAIVGGRTQEDIHNTFNRAFLSARQPGSSIKPLVAYTPMLEKGYISLSKVIDEEVEDGPRNVTRDYRGEMTVNKAVEISINTIPFKIVKEELGPRKSLSYLEEMDFSHLSHLDNNAGISIGGFTYGTNTLEMASAFSTLSRNGKYIKPTGIEKIVDITDIVLYENKREEKTVYNAEASYLMTDILKNVITGPSGTGRHFELENHIAAAKTGTTNDNWDFWFAGYTPYYSTVVWVGNDNPKNIGTLQGDARPGSIWKKYMDKIHEGLEVKDFDIPEGIRKVYIDPETGFISDEEVEDWEQAYISSLYYNLKSQEEEKIKLEEEEQEKKRQEEEEERKRKEEEAENQKRLEELAEFGINEQEEKLREEKALLMIEDIKSSKVSPSDNFNQIYSYLDEIEEAINLIAISSVRNEYMNMFNKEKDRILGEISKIEEDIRKEEERKRKEEEERKHKEEEERKRQEEQERKEREEQERKEKENEDNDNSDNEEPPVEDDPIEEEPVEDEPSEGEPGGEGNPGGDKNIGNNN